MTKIKNLKQNEVNGQSNPEGQSLLDKLRPSNQSQSSAPQEHTKNVELDMRPRHADRSKTRQQPWRERMVNNQTIKPQSVLGMRRERDKVEDQRELDDYLVGEKYELQSVKTSKTKQSKT